MTDLSIDQTAAAAALNRDERLLLWGMRTWTAGVRAGVPVASHLTRHFTAEGAETAVPTLDAVMAILHASGMRAFHHPQCRCLGDEERLLLDILALHQRGEDGAALFLTRLLLTPGAARLLGSSLHALAMALLASGVRLSDGRSRAAVGRAPAPAVWAPSTATLH